MMKYLAILFLLSGGFEIAAQISEGGMPYSFEKENLKSTTQLVKYTLQHPDTISLLEEDQAYPTPYRYGVITEEEINLKNGSSESLANPAGTIWKYEIDADQGYSIQIFFKKFNLPEGASLYVYNKDYSIVYGAFTNKNNAADSTFTLADFPGKQLILEYFEPKGVSRGGRLIIGSMGLGYRDFLNYSSENTESADYIDINCEAGRNYQTAKHAVCRMTFRSGLYSYLCSGALINNTQNDGTPYFLTANHCISDTSVAKTLVTYFNYEKKYCGGSTASYKTLSGAALVTTGSKSDYTLLRLNTTPTAAYFPYYAGWDISSYKGKENTTITHPEGLVKKIAIDHDSIITYNYTISWQGEGSTTTTTPASSHWQVVFDEGTTSGGSSGGPLLSNQYKIIGQLHGGDTATNTSYYGKLNYSWTNPTSKYKTLKTYLDPTSSGVQNVSGYYPATNMPDAFFYANATTVCLDYPITLHDLSTFAPTSWEWTISPSTYTFTNGTSKNSQNPQVIFNTAGSYSIQLMVKNTAGQDSLEIPDYITAGSSLSVDITSSAGINICYPGMDSLVLEGSGANTYTWSLTQDSPEPFYISRVNGDSVIIKPTSGISIDSTFTIQVNMTGIQGSCTSALTQSFTMIKQVNDDIADAIEISEGSSGPYSNECASVETNEPAPAAGSCTGTTTWCDEYGTGTDLAEHTVWFKFLGPSTGKAYLKAEGFDTQIAIYSANTYEDILNGSATILAANDDISSSDYESMIPSVSVTSGKTYWIQVDGSGGGTEGEFTLTLSDHNLTSTNTISEEDGILVYPVPVSDNFTIQGDILDNQTVRLRIYSVEGKLWYDSDCQADGNMLNINASNLCRGVYIVKMQIGDKQYVTRFVKS